MIRQQVQLSTLIPLAYGREDTAHTDVCSTFLRDKALTNVSNNTTKQERGKFSALGNFKMHWNKNVYL